VRKENQRGKKALRRERKKWANDKQNREREL